MRYSYVVKKKQNLTFEWLIPVNDVIRSIDPYFVFVTHNLQLHELSSWPTQEAYSKNVCHQLQNAILSYVEKNSTFAGDEPLVFSISSLCGIEVEARGKSKIFITRFNSEWFDSEKYLKRYVDVSKSNMDPLLHFLTYGYLEERFFDCQFHPKFANLKNMRSAYELAAGQETETVTEFFNSGHISEFTSAANRVVRNHQVQVDPEVLKIRTRVNQISELNAPIVSFVIPCYNQSDFLPDLLQSIGKSTSFPHECLVIDDGNQSEAEVRKIESVQTDYSHQSIKILSSANRGLPGARNIGIENAVGKYVKFIDADDLLIAGSVDKQVEFIEKQQVDACIGGYIFFGIGFGHAIEVLDVFQEFRDRKHVEEGFWTEKFFIENWEEGLTIPIHSLLIKREATLRFDETLNSKEDFDFWLKLISSNAKIQAHLSFVAIYRIHNNQMTKESKTYSGYFFWKILEQRIEQKDLPDLDDAINKKMKYLDRYYGQSARELYQLIGRG